MFNNAHSDTKSIPIQLICLLINTIFIFILTILTIILGIPLLTVIPPIGLLFILLTLTLITINFVSGLISIHIMLNITITKIKNAIHSIKHESIKYLGVK